MIKESFVRLGGKLAKQAAVMAIKTKNAKPEILVVGGVVLLVAGGVAACVQTTKAVKQIDTHKEKIEKIKEKKDTLDEKSYRKAISKTYIRTGTKLAKTYAVPTVLVVGGAVSVLYGHNILRKEHAEILAAYGTMQTAYEEYRGRVRSKYGEDIEETIFSGEEITESEVVTDDGKGNVKKEVVKTKFVNPIADPYTVIFEEVTAPSLWTPSASTNRMNVVSIQSECQRMLDQNGYLFLNDVLRMLGMKETSISRKVGWIRHDSSAPYTVGDSDGFVDFGIFRRGAEMGTSRYEFLNGDEPNFTMHFNVQGIIIDKFENAAKRAI